MATAFYHIPSHSSAQPCSPEHRGNVSTRRPSYDPCKGGLVSFQCCQGGSGFPEDPAHFESLDGGEYSCTADGVIPGTYTICGPETKI